MNLADTVYCSVAAATAGWVTKSSSGTINVSSAATKAKVSKAAQYSKAFGQYMVGIEFVR
jgi:hypothetical protein